MKAFFFQNNLVLHQIFQIQIFWFSPKKTEITWKDISKKKDHLRRILEKIATCSDFEKFQDFFSKKPIPKNS